jgi:hypothetical protein
MADTIRPITGLGSAVLGLTVPLTLLAEAGEVIK